jgi:hypothetical protein
MGLFVDDPTDAADPNSIVALESAINWWDSAFGNRLNDLRTGSRWIVGDPFGTDSVKGDVERFLHLKVQRRTVSAGASAVCHRAILVSHLEVDA